MSDFPISTSELEFATDAIQYPRTARGVDRTEQIRAYREQISALEARWARGLQGEYLNDIVPSEVAERVFAQAWSDGHSSGYHEVESHYQELATLINFAVEQVQAARVYPTA